MKIIDIKPIDVLNGTGTRVSIWLAGCSHHCEGCFSKNTWPWTGYTVNQFMLYEQIHELMTDPVIKRAGISLLGGDPLYYQNRTELLQFLKWFRAKFPDKDVWLWTGYRFEECLDMSDVMEILSHVDVLVDGRFEKDLADPSLAFRGSSNQRILHLENGYPKS